MRSVETWLWIASVGWALITTVLLVYFRVSSRRERVHQNHLQALIDSIPDLTWIKDRDSRFLLVNQQFARAFKLPPEDLIGKTDLDISPRDQALDYLEDDRKVIESGENRVVEERITGENGAEAWAETTKVPVRSARGDIIGTAGTARDITERKRAEAYIKHLAHHDYLTSLPNRMCLEQRCQQYLKGQADARAGLIFIDLDNFKYINDTLGHRAGDKMLRILANRLSRLVADHGWAGRFGGDEFVLFLTDLASAEALEAWIDTTLTTLAEPVTLGTLSYEVTASVGYSYFPDDGNDYEDLLRSADLAMYQAKHRGRNRSYRFEPALGEQSLFRMSIRKEIKHALEQQNFFIEYQPKVDCHSGSLVGLEALVRWQHPSRGRIAPDEFIFLAEQTGQIIDLGDWVLDSVIRQLAQWSAKPLDPVTVSVNLSAVQLHQTGFADRLESLLKLHGVPAQRLELELTESILMGQEEAVTHTLNRLRTLGIVISIDDFGTGYSSLSYLCRFPIDVLKIDRSFVDCVDQRRDQQQVVRAIVQLARSLELDIVAEGVERVDEVHFFRDLGVSRMQGYYFAHPMTMDALERQFDPMQRRL